MKRKKGFRIGKGHVFILGERTGCDLVPVIWQVRFGKCDMEGARGIKKNRQKERSERGKA
jgi:hypothetical protein